MSESVFDSYLKSVYGGGLNFFDSIHGGNEDIDIFGGVNPAEILDEIDDFYPKQKKAKDSDKNSDPISEESIIGYIQIGIHTTPIVGSNPSDSAENIIAPINLQLNNSKKEKIGPKAVGKILRQLNSS